MVPSAEVQLPSSKEPFSRKAGSPAPTTEILISMEPPDYVHIDIAGWKNAQLRHPSIYHPTDFSHVEVPTNSWKSLLEQLPKCLRALSIQATYKEDPASAALLTMEGLEMHLCLWKSRKSDDTIIVEIQRRRGDAVLVAQYCRKILDAVRAEHTFDESEYKTPDTTLNVKTLQHIESLINQAISSSGERLKSPENTPTPQAHAEVALKIVHALLGNAYRLDERHMGFESLCIMSDPRRTIISTSIATASAILSGESPSVGTSHACQTIHTMIMKVLLKREFGDEHFELDEFMEVDSDAEAFGPSGDEDEGSNGKHPPEYVQFMNVMFNLALTSLVNALEVIASFHEAEPQHYESISSMADKLLKSAAEIGKDIDIDLLQTLVDCVRRAERRQHNAYLAAKGLKYLMQASPQIREHLLNDLKVGTEVRKAAEIGYARHALLQAECEALFRQISA